MALGELVVAAGHIELRIALLAGALLGLPNQRVGIYLFGRQDSSRALGIVKDAVKLLPEGDARTRVEQWRCDAAAAYQERNAAIHGTIVLDPSAGGGTGSQSIGGSMDLPMTLYRCRSTTCRSWPRDWPISLRCSMKRSAPFSFATCLTRGRCSANHSPGCRNSFRSRRRDHESRYEGHEDCWPARCDHRR